MIELPRPRKWRRVCNTPKHTCFGPIDGGNKSIDELIVMTVDEYETIRLIDLEGMSQLDCSELMNVGRTTAQRIYNQAKKKLAKALVEGKAIKIEGGDYEVCSQVDTKGCGHGKCNRRRHGRE